MGGRRPLTSAHAMAHSHGRTPQAHSSHVSTSTHINTPHTLAHSLSLSKSPEVPSRKQLAWTTLKGSMDRYGSKQLRSQHLGGRGKNLF